MLRPKYLLILSTDPAETCYNIKVYLATLNNWKIALLTFDNVTTPEQGKHSLKIIYIISTICEAGLRQCKLPTSFITTICVHCAADKRIRQVVTVSQDNSILNGHPTWYRFSGVVKLRVNCFLFAHALKSRGKIVFYDNKEKGRPESGQIRAY